MQEKIKNYRLLDSTLYVTLQPCIMCCGAIINSRIKRLVFGANSLQSDQKYSLRDIFLNSQKDYKLTIKKNVMKQECANILVNFFQKKENSILVLINS